MKLSMLPLQNDNLIRVRCDGVITLLHESGSYDPLVDLLGPQCYGHKVLLGLERAPAIDTSGISWLIRVQKRFAEAGGKLVLYLVPPVILQILDFMRLTSLVEVAHSEVEAKDIALGITNNKAGEGNSLDQNGTNAHKSKLSL